VIYMMDMGSIRHPRKATITCILMRITIRNREGCQCLSQIGRYPV
jgi:hypothetical protein